MIITVTLNPALDKTATVDVMRPNALNRLRDVRIDAGGKGVNVSAMIRALGGSSVAVGFAGGSAGNELLSLIEKKSLKADFVGIKAVTRTNLKVMDDQGALTELNEPGPEITAPEWTEMQQKLYGYAKPGNTIVLSGSLPAGLGKDTYQKLTQKLRRCGASVFLDADSEGFRLAMESPPDEVPNCIKPNRYELLQYFGLADDSSIGDAKLAELCRILLDRGVKLVALSMGKDGALFANQNGVWRSEGLRVPVRSTVGAGDSMVGALVYSYEQGLTDEGRFSLAIAASAGACTTEGTNPPEQALIGDLLTKTRLEKIA
ncbi:MAG: 1-phosphofructokinase family hexose kinase [Spirochaetaceae bacterium]|jgi:1-phosphofructokinase|nr:1-phosphofructokinase family hexose kinase [Spirochaetaceae bacterium]